MSTEPEVTDPTAEEIVGKENVVQLLEPVTESMVSEACLGYHCSHPGCAFRTSHLSEMEEHVNGTGHGGYKLEEPAKPVQPQLFREPGVIKRSIEVRMSDEAIAQKQATLAALYRQLRDVESAKESAVKTFNAEIKAYDEQMQAIDRVLRAPYTFETVDCVWRVIEGENARGLYRLDNGDMLEQQPLTEEDRQAELDRLKAEYKAETAAEAPADGPAAEGDFINNRYAGRKKRKAAPANGEPEETAVDESTAVDTEAAAAIVDEMSPDIPEEFRKDPLEGEMFKGRKRRAGKS